MLVISTPTGAKPVRPGRPVQKMGAEFSFDIGRQALVAEADFGSCVDVAYSPERASVVQLKEIGEAMTPIGRMPEPVSLVIELAGAHKFSYTKVHDATGQTVWRWPLEPPLSERVEAKGQILDLSV